MGLGRLLIISLLIISISGLLVYFIAPETVNLIYTVKYQSYGKPELGYFITVLESIIYGLKDTRILIIIISTSLLAGLLYTNGRTWVAGAFTYIILLILLLIFYYRFFTAFNIPELPEFLTNIFFTITMGAIFSSIPGIMLHITKKENLENESSVQSLETTITCPKCGEKYNSIPIICVKCGFKIGDTSPIKISSDYNCAN
ncbi:MAG: hypothetical protein QW327_03755 [Candidatus Odinarchaeota archaeon]